MVFASCFNDVCREMYFRDSLRQYCSGSRLQNHGISMIRLVDTDFSLHIPRHPYDIPLSIRNFCREGSEMKLHGILRTYNSIRSNSHYQKAAEGAGSFERLRAPAAQTLSVARISGRRRTILQKISCFCFQKLRFLNFFGFLHNFCKKVVDFIFKAYIIGIAKKMKRIFALKYSYQGGENESNRITVGCRDLA